MTLPEDGALLRIFVGESDRHEGKLLYEWLVGRAKERGLAGATVLRGVMGFGAHSRLHTFKIERLAEDLPITVEIVDSQKKVEEFLAFIEQQIVSSLLATVQTVELRLIERRPG